MDSHGSHCQAIAFTLSLLLLFHSPFPSNAATKRVEGVCKQAVDYASSNPGTVSYANCLEAFESDSRARYASNFKDLTTIALGLAVTNATESQAYIDGLLERSHTAAIERCSSWYEGVVARFQSARDELDEDFVCANIDVKVAGDYASNCENELVSAGVKVAAISTRNNYVHLYSSIAFVITKDLSYLLY
ncbi:hypothetical protein CJ030_MR0G005128 [Morella rubra]|uniref:Pectinesterase inhibitor domain-containing protein n=1 Tax=Morella rubra TaxID=262757 RepID=A0A6A1ULE4_9ROSI|nr:hypothetical protein CJ030_MR0G005128 [Morella rubra]